MSRERHRSRVNRGVWKLVAAGAFGTSAITAVIADERRQESGGIVDKDRLSVQAVALTSGITAALLADGIMSLRTESNEEERYERWLSLRVKDDTTAALFEGELAAAAAESRRSAHFGSALWIGVATTGAAMLALTPLSHFERDSESGAYAAGAILLGIGVWKAIANLTGETWNERAFRLYQERRLPRPETSLSITPALAANGGGITLSGTF